MLNDLQQAIKQTVRNFAQDRICPRSAAFKAAGGYPLELLGETAGLGFWEMVAPEIYGGAEVDAVCYALALMEIAAADGALSTIGSIQNLMIVDGRCSRLSDLGRHV